MSEKNFEIYDLRVNQITEALGLDVERPVFSWKLKSEKQNTLQKQAQILVGKTAGSADVWDSGVMDTDESASKTAPEQVLYLVQTMRDLWISAKTSFRSRDRTISASS